MIRVCMLVHNTYHTDARVRRYAESLTDAGAQVDVLCLRSAQQTDSPVQDKVRVFSIPLIRFAQTIPQYAVEYLIAVVLFTIQLLVLFVRNRYHIIHAHNMPDFIVFATLIPRLFGAKVILDIHDPMPEFYMSKFKSRRGQVLEWFMRLQEKLSSRCAHAVITANPAFRERLIGRGLARDKIIVVNNIPDPILFDRRRFKREVADSKHDFVLVYPGTIAPRYGLEVAVRSLPRLLGQIPNLRLLIVGKRTAETTRLTGLAEKLGVGPSLELKHGISITEIPGLLARADVGIYTGLSDPYMDIIVPTKVLEYAWMGLPIVASRLPALENMFDSSAIMFFEPGDAEQFSQCILRLHEAPSLREKLVRRVDEAFVKRHGWGQERQTYFELLNSMLPAEQKLTGPSQDNDEQPVGLA